jgi:hypothetical protein
MPILGIYLFYTVDVPSFVEKYPKIKYAISWQAPWSIAIGGKVSLSAQ